MEDRSSKMRIVTAVLVGALVLSALYQVAEDRFLLFHTVVELATIVVDVSIFVMAWNTRRYLDNNYLLFVGIASVFIAGLDLCHALAYKGIGVFPSDSGNLATQLWIAARYVQSASLLAAPFFLRRRLNVDVQMAALTAVCVALLLSIFVWPVFPGAYVAGQGLTPFKKISEYLIAAGFAGAAGLLYRERSSFQRTVWQYLAGYLVLNIAAELTFTTYVSVYGRTNVVGHLLRLAATYFLYKAVVETGLVKPYSILLRSLKLSEERLRQDAATLQIRNEELRRSQAELRAQADVLERRNEELDAYAHTVAHDLKTPLSVIVSASEVITTSRGLAHGQLHELLQSVKSTALDMSGIIDELLLLSEVRKRDVPLEPLVMDRVVAMVCDRLAGTIEEYAAEIRFPSSWPIAMGHEPWIEEVWANYLTNGLKYGGRPPRLELGAAIESEGMARFWVDDNGAGVSPEARTGLFMPFTQARRLGRGSHGLGLSIVSRIVDKLGGRVGMEPAPSGGSRFHFTLPLCRDQAQEPVVVGGAGRR